MALSRLFNFFDLVVALAADEALSALVTPEATSVGSVTLPGSVVLAGGAG